MSRRDTFRIDYVHRELTRGREHFLSVAETVPHLSREGLRRHTHENVIGGLSMMNPCQTRCTILHFLLHDALYQ